MYGHQTVASTGKLVIIGTCFFVTIGSTLFLKRMSYPYVTSLREIASTNPNNRRFVADRLDMFGRNYSTEFSLSEVEAIKVHNHPFANFKVKDSYYFVFLKIVEDEELKQGLNVSFMDKK